MTGIEKINDCAKKAKGNTNHQLSTKMTVSQSILYFSQIKLLDLVHTYSNPNQSGCHNNSGIK